MSINIQHLNKSFANVTALKDINLTVPEGQLVSLLGPSGCGKTTLLRIIAGLEYADSGHILFNEQDVTEVPVKNRGIGFMFQNYALFRHLNVFENIAFGLRVLPRKQRPSKEAINAKVNRLLDLIQLPHLAKRLPSQLSGGQRQRVALARALATDPKLLLLDEPFGALDAKVRKDMRQWLSQIQQQMGISTILVTHDQEEALEISDQIVLMNHGRIEQIGTGTDFYEAPQSPFVSRFMGDVSLFEGQVQRNQWHFGNFSYDLSQQSHIPPEGSAVAYVSSHDWQLQREPATASLASGPIEHIQDMGPWIRITVKDTSTGQRLETMISRVQQKQLQYAVGEIVHLSVRRLSVFDAQEAA
ncbi:sulfate/molybdate ABC transporter ATP-binding protein [Brackiella oedipodis]|uniref:sulfate/molybdate ABC transporter ATP-binding protein n=1 Tax=Brackiella oedipodis TaxID=124225 RepID=UPI00048D4EC6|nr:sulfate/molybdate ABC transporter ATP-binding protein [Brackiella oedipodis]